MSNDLDTLPTTLYVLIDDHVVPPRTGRGRRPELTDSELLCLAVAQVLPNLIADIRAGLSGVRAFGYGDSELGRLL